MRSFALPIPALPAVASRRAISSAITPMAVAAIAPTTVSSTLAAPASPVTAFPAVRTMLAPLTRIAAVWTAVTTLAAFRLATTAHLLVALRHGRAAGQTHPALFINPQALHPDLVAHLDDIFGLLDPEVGQFADVHQAVLARQEFDKRAKFFDRDDFAAVNLANLRLGRHPGYGVPGDLHPF